MQNTHKMKRDNKTFFWKDELNLKFLRRIYDEQ